MDTWLEGMQSVACICCVFRAKANIKLCVQHGWVLADRPQVRLRYEGVFGHRALKTFCCCHLFSSPCETVWVPSPWLEPLCSRLTGLASVGTAILFPSCLGFFLYSQFLCLPRESTKLDFCIHQSVHVSGGPYHLSAPHAQTVCSLATLLLSATHTAFFTNTTAYATLFHMLLGWL